MNAQAILQAHYLDILFDNRNKSYGGYVLRKEESKRAMHALVLLVSICTVLVSIILLPGKQVVVNTATTKPHTICEMKQPPAPELPKQVEVQPEPPASKPTIKNTVPTIAHDDLVIATLPSIDSFADMESGPVTNTGTPAGNTIANNDKTGTGTARVAPPLPDEPIIVAEVMPEFAGDIQAYLAKNVRYPQMAVQTGIQGRVLIQFVVDEDGSI